MNSPIPDKKQSGMALVIVLCFLVIISALIVAFFASVTTELASSKSYAAGVTAKQLSDMATNMVMAQIRDATRGYQNPDDPSSGVLSWASQPGMIRTFDDTGAAYAFYKLYSSGNMVLRSMSPQFNVNDEFDRDVPTDWATEAGVYTDLNAPVIVPDANGAIQINGSNFRADYPILDPSAATNPAVEGFTIGPRLGPTSVTNPAVLPNPNPAALPCRWLYTLKDGTMISPSNAANGKVTFENSPVKPDANNPIVGRVAFWADDESSKVNVNTAGEGTFWDIPRSTNTVETAFANNMPAQNEFQRQPGHPGMTCLSTVFENLSPYWSLTAKSGYATAIQHYMDFAPRLEFGGSQGGTAPVTGSTAKVVNDHDRLFASLDELAFDVRYKGANTPLPGRNPDPNIGRADLEKLRFFLTANSRAPETNLFNLPRICLWPIQKDTQYRTAKEQLIAFCTSTGTSASGNTGSYYPYYFQRQSIFTGDARTLTMPAPSAASSWEDFALSTSGPVATNSTASRNAVLYNYLRRLTSKSFPGFGGSFEKKYDAGLGKYSDRDQILTEIYDMNRAAVNTYTSGSTVNYNYAQGHPLTAESQVVPEVITASGAMNDATHLPAVTKGFGRFLTIPEVAVIFFSPPPGAKDPAVPAGMRIVKAAVVVGFFNATPSPVTWSPHMRVGIKGLSQFRVSNGQSLNLPDANQGGIALPCNFMTGRCGIGTGAGPFGGGGNHGAATHGLLVQFQHATGNSSDAPKAPGNDGTDSTFPFVTLPPYPNAPYGGAALVQLSGGTMSFSGGTIQIQIFAGYETVTPGQLPKQLIQTLNVKFPSCSCPIPDPTPDDFGARLASGFFIEGTPNSDNTDLVKGDVVRSMQVPPNNPRSGTPNAAMGDLRILAAIPVVPTAMFQPHPDYANPGKRAAHNLRTGGGGGVPPVGWSPTISPPPPGTPPVLPQYGYFWGGNPKNLSGNAGESALVANQNKWSPEPVAAPGQTSAASSAGATGDFDNGYGSFEDGAYINKPDEASAANPGAALLNGRGGLYPETGSTYSPNRQVSSAVLFGSLPSGVKATEAALYGDVAAAAARPWQTLLFCPNPAAGPNHPGFGTSAPSAPAPHTPPYITPPDHLWLDLFTMPVVEPYAISEPFSTAGKVNLNYQIAPFRHITRSTAVRAVMKGVQILGIPTADPDRKGGVRYPIEVEPQNQGTLVGFENIFSRGDIFRSASQICDIFLVPKNAGATYGGMNSWWAKNMHTGDNSRELPYGRIYPCVTTKSNVFTVHMRVQVLQKGSGAQADPAVWDETKDRLLSEYRGSNIVERYIDASDPTLPDFAAASPTPPPLDSYYKFRVVSSKRFCP